MAILHTAYRDEVRGIMGRLKASGSPNDPSFQKKLIKALVDCFHLTAPEADPAERAKVILDALFDFSVSDFITKHVADSAVAKSVLIELLYGLYYGGVNLSAYRQGDFEFLVLQVMAEKAPIASVLKTLSLDKTVRFIAFLFRSQREGTFAALRQFDHKFQQLIFWLKRYYYDSDFFTQLVDNEKLIDEAGFTKIVKGLEEFAELESKELCARFTELVTAADSCVKTIAAYMGDSLTDPVQIEALRVQHEQVKKRFAAFYQRTYTEQDFLKFARTFGLKGYPGVYVEEVVERTSVVQKAISLARELSSKAVLVMQPEVLQPILSYVFTLIAQLDAHINNPLQYKEGLDLFTCSIATSGKVLANQVGIASILDGYKELVAFLDAYAGTKISLANYPIVIFDQSERALFEKNSQYIQTLNIQYESRLVHVSKADAAALAAKIGVERLIVTEPNGNFGFGGARNCQFLLTGVIREAFRRGKKLVSEIVELPKEVLLAMFQERILGANSKCFFGEAVFMVDDDMLVAEANIFSAALLAKLGFNDPLVDLGYEVGRASKFNLKYWDLQEVLAAPENTYLFPLWITKQLPAGMSEQLIKPKICLNLPQGSEENHHLTLLRGHSFLKPAYHLCGSRYPNQEVPTNAFVGLDAYLAKAAPYVLCLYLTAYLLAPKSRHTPTALPWNTDELSAQFENLRESFTYIADERNQKELQTRFWKKVHELFCLELEEYKGFLDIIHALLNLDVDDICTGYVKQHALAKNEKESLAKLGNVYKASQADVKLFWKFGKALGASENPARELDVIREKLERDTGQKIAQHPVTEGLYLMACSVGRGEFCQIIRNFV